MTTSDFAALGLPAHLVQSLANGGFTVPTPIQLKAIPAQLEGRDILGIAETGSGKTAAFALPILDGLAKMQGRPEPKTARALILAPTRELAVQIEEAFRKFAGSMNLSTALVLGGVSRYKQVEKLARGVDVLIATPGRLKDLFEDRKVRLDKTKWLVLDEADRMLDMGFIAPVRQMAAAIGGDRQTALFSATMAPEIAKLAASLLKNPVRVEASPAATVVSLIDQQVIMAPTRLKRDKLNELLGNDALSRVLVFSRTKHGADKVAKFLDADGHLVAAIHGNKNQNARQNALRGFKNGKVRILVATDIAARGIDVPDISHVINYELPDDPENYVHRIGRTGRNGASGVAITLVDGGERGKLRDVERLIRQKLPVSGELTGADALVQPETRAPRRNGPSRNGPARNGTPHRGKPQGAKAGGRPQRGAGGSVAWWAKLEGKEGGKPAGGQRARRKSRGGPARHAAGVPAE
jgi:ATP-dependent RNA helicase RhlE